MLSKNGKWIASACIALSVFCVMLLMFDGNTSYKVSSMEWSRIGSNRTASPSHPPSRAIATFLTGQSTTDDYFNMTRVLSYQLLHAPDTRILNPDIAFIIFCGKQLPEWKREILRNDGATVIEFEDVPVPSWIEVATPRWSEQFTKLRIFEQTQYSRILYMDADFLLLKRMDDIFNERIAQELTPTFYTSEDKIPDDELPLPSEWFFSARSELGAAGGHDHTIPPLQIRYFNAGFWLTAPQQNMFEYFMRIIQLKGRFRTQFMEQDMLNYAFRRTGPMPWRELDWKWASNFVNQRDVDNGVHALHGKFFMEGPQVVQDKWRDIMSRIEARSRGQTSRA